MKNYNLTLAIIPCVEKETLLEESEAFSLGYENWLRKKSLSTKTIKNHKAIIDCIINIIKENVPEPIKGTIQIKNNVYYINSSNASELLKITDDFTNKYKLIIQKNLSQIIYVYELKTYAEITKEINGHLKTLNDYLNQLHDDLSLIIICEYEERQILK
jgi:hypothetical protein